MVRKNRARSSSLFLMELIIAILFFSVASAVCVQFFVKSHLLSNDSDALNHAVNECAAAAEIVDACNTMEDSINTIKSLYPDGDYTQINNLSDNQETDVTIYYNDFFEKCKKEDSAYALFLHLTLKEQILITDMNAVKIDLDKFDNAENSSDGFEIIYELQTKHHIARRAGHEKR